ncbi:TonB-dependent siderophore receptor [Sphingomonas bacterium]|uniref:TonB-dependent siderophore receptor n=1 Tax=Sphingomonas bacterium TaxID=1895847 RepID=UPI001575E22E|nr:TonB-dependent siderophore receptor [Sphingomonas bacterium]
MTAAIGAMALVAGNARAQTAPATPEIATGIAPETADVTVTAQRQPYLGDTPLRLLPQEVQLLDAATLDRAGITRLQTALDFVAGVARQNNLGGLFDGYAIRGFAGDENLAGNYLLNGFNASRGYGGPRDASNIERIEVVKGPTSALFGRGDPGGVVNIVTKKPFFGYGGSVEASGGSYNERRVEGDVNTRLAANLALRVTGAYDEGDSFRDTVHHRTYTVTPSVLWKLGSDTSLTYELEYLLQFIPLDRGVVSVAGRLGVVPRQRFLDEPGDGPIRTQALGHQLQLQHDFSAGWSVLLGASYRDTSLYGYATDAENADARQKLFTDGQTLSRQRRLRDYDTGDTTVRGELSGRFATFGVDHRLQVGADWDWFTLVQVVTRFRPPAVARQTTLAAGDAVNIFAPVYGTLPATGAFISTRETDEEAGVYMQDLVALAPWLELRAGGRFDRYEQHLVDRLTNRVTRQDKTAWNPQVGVSILPTRTLTLYASYGEGFRPNSGSDVTGAAFAPEQTRSGEVGAKLAAFGARLAGSLALFTMHRDNVLTADPVNSGFSLAIGRARSRGVEASVTGHLPGHVDAVLNYAYTDAVIARAALDPNFGFALRAGDPLINVPKNSASGLLIKSFQLGDRQLSLGATVNYVGRRVGQTGYRYADGSQFTLPAYTIAGATASIDLVPRVRLAVDVTNLFDRAYYPSSYSRVWVTPGAPREAMERLRFAF